MKKSTEYLKLLAEPKRLEILTILKTGPKGVSEIKKVTGMEPTLLSHHLGLLRKSGLITSVRIGKAVECKLAVGVNWPRGFNTPAFKITFK